LSWTFRTATIFLTSDPFLSLSLPPPPILTGTTAWCIFTPTPPATAGHPPPPSVPSVCPVRLSRPVLPFCVPPFPAYPFGLFRVASPLPTYLSAFGPSAVLYPSSARVFSPPHLLLLPLQHPSSGYQQSQMSRPPPPLNPPPRPASNHHPSTSGVCIPPPGQGQFNNRPGQGVTQGGWKPPPPGAGGGGDGGGGLHVLSHTTTSKINPNASSGNHYASQIQNRAKAGGVSVSVDTRFQHHRHNQAQQSQHSPGMPRPNALPGKAVPSPSSQNPAAWPPALQNYVQRCFQLCKNQNEKDKVSDHLKVTIQRHMENGTLWGLNWDREPLPEVLHKYGILSPTNTGGQQGQGGGLGLGGVTGRLEFGSTPTGLTYPLLPPTTDVVCAYQKQVTYTI
jgi:hypothetical protein